MYCMKCGAKNDDNARFCIECGTQLTRLQAPPRGPAPPPARGPARPPVRQAAPPPAGQAPPPLAPRTATRPRPAPRRRRGISRWILAFGIAAVALMLLCTVAAAAVYFWLGFHRVNQTARIVPADTPLVISFNPDPRQALHYRDAENMQALVPVFGASPELREVAEEAQNDLLAQFDIDVQEDVMPWIGTEASIAMMDVDASSSSGTPPIIVAIATRNEDRSGAFLVKMREAMEREGTEFEEEIYRDTQVTYVVPDWQGDLAPAFATFNHLVVIGTDREALHQAIDNAQTRDAPVLADQETYREVLRALPSNRLGYLYLDGQSILTDLQDGLDLPMQQQAIRAMGISFGLDSDGVRLDYVVANEAAQDRKGRSPANKLKIAGMVPQETIAYLSAYNVFANWETTFSTAEEMEDVNGVIDEIEYETGVHLVEDILTYMTGEFALVALPDPGGLLGDDDVPLGVLLMAEVEKREAVEAGLDALVDYLVEESASESTQEIEGIIFRMVEDPWEEWAIGYGFVDDVLVIGTSPEMLQAAVQGSDNPLSRGDTFRAARDPLSNRASTYLYLDVQKGIDIVYRSMDDHDREQFNDEVRPYLDPIQAISLGAVARDDDGIERGTLFLLTGD